MRVWIYTTKEIEEYANLTDQSEIKRSSTDKTKKGDIVLIYRGKPYSNIAYILKAKTDPYKDEHFRDDWDIAIDLDEKIEIENPIKFQEMRNDPVLGEWGTVRRNFMGSFFEVPPNEWERLKKIILNKNPELDNQLRDILIGPVKTDYEPPQTWTFAIRADFYNYLQENDRIKWNSAKEVRKGDIILIYTGAPYSSIGFILKAISNPFEDSEIRENWNRPAIMVEKVVEIPKAIQLSDLKENSILSEWGAVRFNFRRSHFKMTDEEWEEMKKLILEKNPELGNEIEDLKISYMDKTEILPESIGYYDLNAGRAHIVRDLCYLLSEKKHLSEDELFDLLRKKVDDDDYWKAYFSRSNENTSPLYSLNSARTLGLVDKTLLKLTKKGEELVESITSEETYTNHYSSGVKKFFFKLATQNPYIKTAMQILKEKGRLRFYAPICKETNKVAWDWKIKEDGVICESEQYEECKSCDKDLVSHIKESSLPFETELLGKKGYGSVFWMCSRVTPMHLTGSEPVYSGSYIYWDDKAEEELGDLIELINENENYDDLEIKDFLKKIFSDYPSAKSKEDRVKDHALSKSFRIFAQTLKYFSNKYFGDYDKEYGTYTNYHSGGIWVHKPYIALSSNRTDKYIISYSFTENTQGVNLSIEFNWGYITPLFKGKLGIDSVTNEMRRLIEKEAYNFYNESLVLAKNPKFNFPDIPSGINQYCTICTRYYDKHDLPSEEVLKTDLMELLDIYDKLNDYDPTPTSFSEYLREKKFLYTPEMVENFLISLSVKPFVILTGSSGTGKTKIAQLFAEYLLQKNEADYMIIPVGANWSENRHLMGFYNVITHDYESTPALDLIIEAHNNPEKPYFLILDEMNLSHVERYFSDFLSAMESGKEIELYSKHKVGTIKNKNIPQKLKIPDNLLVVGTVNVDETTYMFSPKVLDRANTIEFTTYPAHDYIMCIIEHLDPEGRMDLLENPLYYLKNRDANIAVLKDFLTHVQLKNGDNLWSTLAREIHTFQETLSLASFDFGFRVINEIIRFMYIAWLYEDSPHIWDNWERYFDAQIMQKMLPKIHGSQRELEVLLEELFKLTYNDSYTDIPWVSLTLKEDKIKYPSSAAKIQSLGRSLQEKRYASFNV